MAVDDSLNPPHSEYVRRWIEAIEKAQYDSALSILDEGLQAATRENNAEEINQYTNLIKIFSQDGGNTHCPQRTGYRNAFLLYVWKRRGGWLHFSSWRGVRYL
jgi:hypothetical protein